MAHPTCSPLRLFPEAGAGVHAFVQDTHDFDGAAGQDAKEDDVAAGAELAVAGEDIRRVGAGAFAARKRGAASRIARM